MVAIAFVLFSACCTLLSVISVIFFGVSVSYIVKLYFLYLTLTAVMVIAILGSIFLFDRIQKGSRACFPSPTETTGHCDRSSTTAGSTT
jgi:hypothetical protein